MSDFLNSTKNLVHPEWEVIDPTPDIRVLFNIFDKKFFQNKLECVDLEWSKKMYSCAGICYQRRNRMGMSCTIRLSEPLLKLRSRKDLVETLIHEMIHAYCFILNIREGNGGHGPIFIKIMQGINKIAGTNITVYHTFHDEVKLYKTHWWQCNGVCKNNPPFYGYVKRTSNRAPGPNDRWFGQHKNTCGGTFIKIREPEKKKRGGGKENTIFPKTSKIQDFFNRTTPTSNNIKTLNNTTNTKGGTMANWGGGTVVIRKPPQVATKTVPNSIPKDPIKIEKPISPPNSKSGKLENVVSLKDIITSTPDKNNNKRRSDNLFVGTGHTLGGLENQPSKRSRLLDQFKSSPIAKPPKPTVAASSQRSATNIVDLSLDDGEDDVIRTINLDEIEYNEIQIAVDREFIKKEILDSIKEENLHDSDLEDDIILIDNDYDDFYVNSAADDALVALNDSLLDDNVINDIFDANDSLMDDFNTANDKKNDASEIDIPENEIISCPVCLKKMKRLYLDDHLDKCVGLDFPISSSGSNSSQSDSKQKSPSTSHDMSKGPSTSQQNLPPSRQNPSTSAASGSGSSNRSIVQSSKSTTKTDKTILNREQIDLLLEAGYCEADIIAITGEPFVTPTAAPVIDLVGESASLETCACPVCGIKVKLSDINSHLDVCCDL